MRHVEPPIDVASFSMLALAIAIVDAQRSSPLSSDKMNTEQSKEEEIVVVEAEPVLFQTKLRENVEPYLPPPIVKGWRQVDPLLEPYLGPEPTITLVGSVLLGVLVWQVLKILSSFSGGRAIVGDDDDQVISSSQKLKQDFVATILLCGPPNSGKTRLFYQLCFGETNVSTVTSLRANICVSEQTKIRFVDNPGHASLSSPEFLEILDSSRGIVLVLDTTQPVASVADVLFQLLAHANKKKKPLDIFVACHKTDLPNAKNWRRIKIQLRTEVERLLKVRSMEQESDELWWTPGKPLALENLPNAELQFCSTSCESGVGIQELAEFCNNDMTPDSTAKVELI